MSRSPGQPRGKQTTRRPRSPPRKGGERGVSVESVKPAVSLPTRILRFPGKHPVLRAMFVFSILMGLFYGFVHKPDTQASWSRPHLRIIASLTGSILSVFGYDISVEDTYVRSPDLFALEIVRGCDGIEPAAMYTSAVLASVAPLWTKLPGVLAGILGIYLINLVRVVSLFFIGIHFPGAFTMMHETIWQAAFVLLAVVFWVVWLQWATHRTSGRLHDHG